MKSRFGYRCEYCEGIVREKHVDREAFKHRKGFVILEGVSVGVCDKCGNRYYSADTLNTTADLSSTIREQRQPLLPVREIGNVIPPRMVAHELQRMRGRQGFARQHRCHE